MTVGPRFLIVLTLILPSACRVIIAGSEDWYSCYYSHMVTSGKYCACEAGYVFSFVDHACMTTGKPVTTIPWSTVDAKESDTSATEINHMYHGKFTLIDTSLDLRPWHACDHLDPADDCHVKIKAHVEGGVGFKLKYDLEKCYFKLSGETPNVNLHAEIDWTKPDDYSDQSSFDGLPWEYDYELLSGRTFSYSWPKTATDLEFPFCASTGSVFTGNQEACLMLYLSLTDFCDFSKWVVKAQGTLDLTDWETLEKAVGETTMRMPGTPKNMGTIDLSRRLGSHNGSGFQERPRVLPRNISAHGEVKLGKLIDLGQLSQPRGEVGFVVHFGAAEPEKSIVVRAIAAVLTVTFAIGAAGFLVRWRRNAAYDGVEMQTVDEETDRAEMQTVDEETDRA